LNIIESKSLKALQNRAFYIQFLSSFYSVFGQSPQKIEWFVGFFWLKECDCLQKQVFLNGF
jgi:hypothetical protein